MEKGLAGEEARTRENEWFKEHPNFGRLSVGSARFGVPVLRDEMSRLLTALISRQLPVIHEKVAAEVAAAQKELATLPSPPSENPMVAILKVPPRRIPPPPPP